MVASIPGSIVLVFIVVPATSVTRHGLFTVSDEALLRSEGFIIHGAVNPEARLTLTQWLRNTFDFSTAAAKCFKSRAFTN